MSTNKQNILRDLFHTIILEANKKQITCNGSSFDNRKDLLVGIFRFRSVKIQTRIFLTVIVFYLLIYTRKSCLCVLL